MTVTASCDVRAVKTAEAQKSGKKKSPKKCLMSQWLCYSKLGAWVDTSRSESSEAMVSGVGCLRARRRPSVVGY